MSSAPEEQPQVEEQDESFPEFSLFGDILDGVEQESCSLFESLLDDREPESVKKHASKAEIVSLMKFIGGFKYWNNLNEDCRQEVVKYLEYTERCRLGICSKRDYETVKATPMDVHSIEIQDNEKRHWSFSQEEFDNVVVQIQFHHDFNSGKRFQLIFSQLGEDTEVGWMRYFSGKRPEKRSIIWKSCNYYEEAVKFAEKWMKKCNFELKRIDVEMSKYPFETSTIKSLPKCEKIRIGADDVESFCWWLQNVPEQLQDIQLVALDADREVFTLPTEFLDAPQIMQTPQFYFWCRAAFTDEQFLNLNAKKISFDCVNITDEGINQFIKNWVNRSVFDFKEALLWSPQERDFSELTRGLEVRPWDADFEEEAGGFCGDFERVCGRGRCVQISNRVDPFESLTLSISSDRVSIYASGHKFTYNGRTYTYYSIP